MIGVYSQTHKTSYDVIFFSFIIALMNVHLLGIGRLDSLIFLPTAVASGEYWRMLTHPFAHVSWYHLLLDASAFFILYTMIRARILTRVFHVLACGTFSLGTACLFSPDIQTLGLCGLSGIAHGLIAVVSLEMISTRRNRMLGLLCLSAVAMKSIFEMSTGQVLFASWHHGLCGVPVAACHGGGVLGGVVSSWANRSELND